MYLVEFVYTNNSKVTCHNVDSITYKSLGGVYATATGSNILECNIPLEKDIYLKSSDSSYTVSTHELLSIQISEE